MKLQRQVGSSAHRALDIRLQVLGLLPGALGSHGRAVFRRDRGSAGVCAE